MRICMAICLLCRYSIQSQNLLEWLVLNKTQGEFMPLLDSFKVDHTIMPAPAVRLAKTMQTPKGDKISVFDLRFCVPNEDILSEKGIHTLEHLFAGFMRDHLNAPNVEIIDISPMGCRTGFYMSVIGSPSDDLVREAWEKSMRDVLNTDAIPGK